MAGGRENDSLDRETKTASSNRCSCIKEGELGNVAVTAPGATLALGLMFMRTNNIAVAARLSTPDTHFLLEYVRPDFILLRVLCRNLILWDSIHPSIDWIRAQIPDIVKTNVQDLFAGRAPDLETKVHNPDTDFEALRQSELNIIAGAASSMGLRFAGSAYPPAKDTLMACVQGFRTLRKLKASSVGGSETQLYRVDKTTLESCLATCALALSLVMAGMCAFPFSCYVV